VLIGVSSDQAEAWLADGLLLDLNKTEVDTAGLMPAGLEAASVDDQLIGLPFTAFTTIMYYNRSLLGAPPLTLDGLIEQAEMGTIIAIPVDFMGSYWGIRAFGGRAFDEDGQVALNQNDALVNWLDWLAAAEWYEPILISTDYNSLAERFARGQVALFMGNSADLSQLGQALGDDLRVSPLPGYPEAGAFMTVELMVINSASAQVDLAVSLFEFLTNPIQQRQLSIRSSGRIPLSQEVRLNQRLYPIAATLQSQSRRSEMILPANKARLAVLTAKAPSLYRQVLEGVVTPEEAADLLLQEASP
jgi:maltose-binding protein MalE